MFIDFFLMLNKNDIIGGHMWNSFILITISHLNKLWKIKKFLKQFDKLDNNSIDTKKITIFFFLNQVKVFCCVGVW